MDHNDGDETLCVCLEHGCRSISGCLIYPIIINTAVCCLACLFVCVCEGYYYDDDDPLEIITATTS